MESLVAKWKNTMNSSRKLTDSSLKESLTIDKLKSSKNLKSLQNSHEKMSNKIKLKISDSSSSNSEDDQILKKTDVHVVKSEKSSNFFIDESVYQIMDIFNNQDKLKNSEKIKKIRFVLDNLVSSISESTQKTTKSTQYMSKIESSSKMMSELETRLFSSEQEKTLLRKKTEDLQLRITALMEELKTKKVVLESFEIIKENNKTFEKTNTFLLTELESSRLKNIEQQRIFESQRDELSLMLRQLKHQYENTDLDY